jgi:hypothetical protein
LTLSVNTRKAASVPRAYFHSKVPYRAANHNNIKKGDRICHPSNFTDSFKANYKFLFFNSFTAKSAARAVIAMYVNEGFTQEAEAIAAPSVMNTFFTS